MALMKGVSNPLNVDALASVLIVPEIQVLLADCKPAALYLHISGRCYKMCTNNT